MPCGCTWTSWTPTLNDSILSSITDENWSKDCFLQNLEDRCLCKATDPCSRLNPPFPSLQLRFPESTPTILLPGLVPIPWTLTLTGNCLHQSSYHTKSLCFCPLMDGQLVETGNIKFLHGYRPSYRSSQYLIDEQMVDK